MKNFLENTLDSNKFPFRSTSWAPALYLAITRHTHFLHVSHKPIIFSYQSLHMFAMTSVKTSTTVPKKFMNRIGNVVNEISSVITNLSKSTIIQSWYCDLVQLWLLPKQMPHGSSAQKKYAAYDFFVVTVRDETIRHEKKKKCSARVTRNRWFFIRNFCQQRKGKKENFFLLHDENSS